MSKIHSNKIVMIFFNAKCVSIFLLFFNCVCVCVCARARVFDIHFHLVKVMNIIEIKEKLINKNLIKIL